MQQPSSPDNPSLADQKLAAEIEKLQVETQALQKTRFSVFADWTKIVGGVILGSIGTFSIIYQWQLAEAKEKNAEAGVKLATFQKESIDKQTQELVNQKLLLEAQRDNLIADLTERQKQFAADQKKLDEEKALPAANPVAIEAQQKALAASTAANAQTLQTIARPRVRIYYANDNQKERYQEDIRPKLRANGFEVLYDDRLQNAARPDVTSILYFHTVDAESARRLRTVLEAEFGVTSCEIKAVQNPKQEKLPTQGGRIGELEIWLDRSQRSPASGLIRLFRN